MRLQNEEIITELKRRLEDENSISTKVRIKKIISLIKELD
jgi:hypothetical protein